MTTKNIDVARGILDSIGGALRLNVALGAKEFKAAEYHVEFKIWPIRGINTVRIYLSALGLFDIEFWHIGTTDASCYKSASRVQINENGLKSAMKREVGYFL